MQIIFEVDKYFTVSKRGLGVLHATRLEVILILKRYKSIYALICG